MYKRKAAISPLLVYPIAFISMKPELLFFRFISLGMLLAFMINFPLIFNLFIRISWHHLLSYIFMSVLELFLY